MFLLGTGLFACGVEETGESFQIEETTIGDIQAAILGGDLTSTQVVEAYLARIKAFNGPCVSEPEGILGPITTIKRAGRVNALITLNLRPERRTALEFDDRKARSMTDAVDDDPSMPDALEVAEQQDAHFAATGELIGPLHGVVLAIKDQFDTHDMRTTSGADAFYANDRPPDDDPRRGAYYGITKLGRQVLAAESRRLARLVAATEELGLIADRGEA